MVSGTKALNANFLLSPQLLLSNTSTTLAKPSSLSSLSAANQILNFKRTQVSTSPDDEQRDKEEKNLLRFEPWKKGLPRFLSEALMSAVTYVVTYWFMSRIGILNMKNFNKHIEDTIRKSGKESHIVKKELDDFRKVLSGVTKNDPLNSRCYWKKYFDPIILKNLDSFSKKDRFFARAYRSLYGSERRWALSLSIALLSLGRALVIHPDLSWIKRIFIFVGPWVTNFLFWRADKMAKSYEDKFGGTFDQIKNNAEVRRGSSIAEINNFLIKLFSKVFKRSGNIVEEPEMFAIATIGAFNSRLVRDSLEGGFPTPRDKNPFFAFIGKSQTVQKMRNNIVPFQKGILDNYGDFKVGENHFLHLAKIAGMKTLLKYITDGAIFGLMGVSALKVVYFIKHKWQHNGMFAPTNYQNLSFGSQSPNNQLTFGGLTGSNDTSELDSLVESNYVNA
ncbi:MAG: hypothetical protein QNJ31_02275 [Candidatus Caenarcaniphilales bacterium]|nr:hypothetical protein [Candidatus Caenarcaniphilales bacterium]